MEIAKEQIDFIRESFQKMASKEELLALLNFVKPIAFGKNAKPFELKQLTYFANPKANPIRYRSFQIKKKSGEPRTIHAPVKGLKAIQKCLNLILQLVFEPHPSATGFVLNRSIVDNAKAHVGSIYVYNVDLKDFFPSIDQARIWKTLQLPPFNLGKVIPSGITAKEGDKGIKKFSLLQWLADGQRLKLNNIISSLLCFEMEVERKNENGEWVKEMRNVLPQGAPTSPIITNIICYKLDKRLNGVAKRFKLKYTRYADDITFSSMHNVYQKDSEFLKELDRIISDQRFHIKDSKTRLQKKGYRQEVTGLLVNEKVNVQARYLHRLRQWLYLWEHYGYEKATNFFLNDYLKERGHLIKGKPNMDNVISGKLLYLSMVKGKEDSTYQKLQKRFDALVEARTEKVDLNKVLDVLINDGLDEAMKIYLP